MNLRDLSLSDLNQLGCYVNQKLIQLPQPGCDTQAGRIERQILTANLERINVAINNRIASIEDLYVGFTIKL